MLDTLTENFAPQFRGDPQLYMSRLLQRNAIYRHVPADLEIRVAPDDSNAVVAASAAFEGKYAVPNRARLWAVSGSSSLAAGFDLQIRGGPGPGPVLFGRRCFYENATGQGGGTPSSPLFILPKPMLLLAATDEAAAQVVVQAWNRADANNSIQVLLWLMIPKSEVRSA
jgi:hypothetical protein